MKVLIVGSPGIGEEARKISEIAKILENTNDSILIISTDEPDCRDTFHEKMKELNEPLLIKPRPYFEDYFFPKQRRTNHERKPSRY